MSIVSGTISLKDNVTAVLRGIKQEHSAFRQDVDKTKKSMRDTWDKKHTAKLESTAAAKKMQDLKQKMEPLRKKLVMATAIKDTVTSKLTAVGNKVKSVGKMVAKPLVAIKDAASAGLSKIGKGLKSLAKGVAIPASIAATAVLVGSITQGAKLEQSIGGVETLFKGDASIVQANADAAFKTAGLSANEYMETVTSFSASLLNSLGGDTAKAASIADMAIIDMSDNANKFGTDMESIQNAYQGFAKQNYTMLDNLKLGYGGTKEEMNRLLGDATKLTGVKYDISNLSDVYSAIHAIQDNLGVTGTTAKEASETFSGSFASMKSAAQNLLGNLAIGGDVTGSMEQLVESAGTFLFDNALPMVTRIITALPGAIKTALTKASPKLAEAGGSIISGLKDGIVSMLPASVGGIAESLFDGVGSLVQGFKSVLPALKQFGGTMVTTFGTVFNAAMPVIQSIIGTVQTVLPQVLPVIGTVLSTIGSLIAQAAPIISFMVETIGATITTLAPIFQKIFGEIGEKVGSVIGFISGQMGFFKSVFEFAMPIISSILQTAWSIINPIMDIAIAVFKVVFRVVQAVFPAIKSIISTVWDFLQPIFEGIGKAFQWLADGIGGLADTVGGWFGKDKANASTEAAAELQPVSAAAEPAASTQAAAATAPATAGGNVSVSVDNADINLDDFEFPKPDPSPAGGGGYTLPAPGEYTSTTPGMISTQPVEQEIDQSVTVQIAQIAGSITVREEADIDAIATAVADRVVTAVGNSRAVPTPA